VVFTAGISGVKLVTLAYAWSQKSISFFISTCGSTARSANAYRSHFENEFGQVDYKDLPRPKLAEFLYEILPLIDEHNKIRQHRLALEKCWQTKNCLFRLIVTICGQSLVDMQRLYRNVDSFYAEWDIIKFSDYVSADLKPRREARVNVHNINNHTLEIQ